MSPLLLVARPSSRTTNVIALERLLAVWQAYPCSLSEYERMIVKNALVFGNGEGVGAEHDLEPSIPDDDLFHQCAQECLLHVQGSAQKPRRELGEELGHTSLSSAPLSCLGQCTADVSRLFPQSTLLREQFCLPRRV